MSHDIASLVAQFAPDHVTHTQEERPRTREAVELRCSCGVDLSITEEQVAMWPAPTRPVIGPIIDDWAANEPKPSKPGKR